ncbi:hypothetical protein BLOT_007213 [Blomia tropicalis]|nr:hypothetical protein BLOT_007213 [Blomia tropicalis]
MNIVQFGVLVQSSHINLILSKLRYKTGRSSLKEHIHYKLWFDNQGENMKKSLFVVCSKLVNQ